MTTKQIAAASAGYPITNGKLNMGNRLAASLVEEPGKESTFVSSVIMAAQGN
jgi:hypothetical protein